jgi:phenylpyruvate tautomerase PptA (4-oxalocrotonate tautomerase family)
MPLIQVSATQGSLNENEQALLMKRLSNAVLKAERAPIESEGAQSLVWAYFHELAKTAVYVGGENLNDTPLRIAVTTPEGALNAATRTELVEEISIIVDDILGPYPERLNHWAMLYELDEGSWAGGGQIFPLVGIQAAMDIKAA